MEKIKGANERDEFIKFIGGGFKETEGIEVDIKNKGKEQVIIINYGMNGERKNLEVSVEILENIVKEKEELEKMIEESFKKAA